MKKEEILNAIKESPVTNDEYEQTVKDTYDRLSLIIGLLVMTTLFIVELIIDKTINFGYLAVSLVSCGISFLFDGIKLKKKINIALGITIIVFSVFAILIAIGKVIFL